MDYIALIIDDDVWMQRILSKTLQSFGFKKTLLTSNGFEGIALAVEYKPHLIVLDILMPELTGHQTLKILKAIKVTKEIPVVVVSALADTENLGMAVKSGTAGFISKPFTRATVYEKLAVIYGKEKLEKIEKGESIEDFDFSHEEFSLNQALEDNSNLFKPSGDVTDNLKINQPKQQIPAEQISHFYHEEDKKTLDSIRKLLLKTKK